MAMQDTGTDVLRGKLIVVWISNSAIFVRFFMAGLKLRSAFSIFPDYDDLWELPLSFLSEIFWCGFVTMVWFKMTKTGVWL